MLRSHNVVTFNTASISLTVTHGLGQVPDAWDIQHRTSGTGTAGHCWIPAASVLTNALTAYHSQGSALTVDVWCIFYDGRLY